MATFEGPFALNQKVYMDGDESMTGLVTAYCWRVENPQIEVSWWNNGSHNSAWFSAARLHPVT